MWKINLGMRNVYLQNGYGLGEWTAVLLGEIFSEPRSPKPLSVSLESLTAHLAGNDNEDVIDESKFLNSWQLRSINKSKHLWNELMN